MFSWCLTSCLLLIHLRIQDVDCRLSCFTSKTSKQHPTPCEQLWSATHVPFPCNSTNLSLPRSHAGEVSSSASQLRQRMHHSFLPKATLYANSPTKSESMPSTVGTLSCHKAASKFFFGTLHCVSSLAHPTGCVHSRWEAMVWHIQLKEEQPVSEQVHVSPYISRDFTSM